MAKGRKIGNLLGLAVLAIAAERPMHPYEMGSTLAARWAGKDRDIKWGSLYSVVQSLSKHGLLQAVETKRDGNRPERTVYRITDAGRAELRDWVRDLIAWPDAGVSPFSAGLAAMAFVDPGDAARLLETRIRLMEDEIARARQALAMRRPLASRLALLDREYDLAVREADLCWTRALLRDVTEGSFPGPGA